MRKMRGKSRNIMLFQSVCSREGPKVGSQKRWVRSNVPRSERKELHATMVRSAFPNQNVKNTHAVKAQSSAGLDLHEP